MTAQEPDYIEYQNLGYAITTSQGSGLFEPQQLGIEPCSYSTGNKRGYCCGYLVDGSQLLLATLELGLSLRGNTLPPQLFGVQPTREIHEGYAFSLKTGEEGWSSWEDPQWTYSGLREFIPFTGRLFIGREFIQSMHVRSWFQETWKYGEVHELTFENGQVVKAVDRCHDVEQLRARIFDDKRTPGYEGYIEALEWARLTLGLDFRG